MYFQKIQIMLLSASLDTHLRFESVCVLRFCSFFFFFFFSRVLAKRGYCLCTVQWTVTAKKQTVHHILFMDSQIPLFNNFFIKNGSHGTIYTFKNYFTIVISAISFQFQQNKYKFHFLATFSLKMGPMILFTHLKIILLQWFQQ